MSPIRTNLDYRETLHSSVVEAAQAVVAGKLSAIEASRLFVGLAAELGAINDADFRFFVGLDSDTDHFPLGTPRELWNARALKREDAERRKLEKSVYREAVARCLALIEKYTGKPRPKRGRRKDDAR
jgi:hypothetical protein